MRCSRAGRVRPESKPEEALRFGKRVRERGLAQQWGNTFVVSYATLVAVGLPVDPASR